VEVAQTKLQEALRIVQAVELAPSTATVPTASPVTATAPVTKPFDLRGTDVVLTSSSGTPRLQSSSSSSSNSNNSSAVLWSTAAGTDAWLQVNCVQTSLCVQGIALSYNYVVVLCV
jgi:hypothetical protein